MTESKQVNAVPVIDGNDVGKIDGKKFMAVTIEFFEKQDGKVALNVVPYRTTDQETDPNKVALAALMVAGVQKSLQHILHILDEGRKAQAADKLPRK